MSVKGMCTEVFLAARCIVAPNGKHPKCLPATEWSDTLGVFTRLWAQCVTVGTGDAAEVMSRESGRTRDRVSYSSVYVKFRKRPGWPVASDRPFSLREVVAESGPAGLVGCWKPRVPIWACTWAEPYPALRSGPSYFTQVTPPPKTKRGIQLSNRD